MGLSNADSITRVKINVKNHLRNVGYSIIRSMQNML
jgi:hypothetical protein